jgi:hypothetical protein
MEGVGTIEPSINADVIKIKIRAVKIILLTSR